MAVPKKKTSYMKKKLRRSHEALKKVSWIGCSQCGEPKLPHRICTNCGSYRGKTFVQVEA